MLIDLSQAIGSYLHEVFVAKFQWWVLLGYLAQIMFTMRFLVQWIASERAGKMVMPIAFWFFSIGGGALLLAYALFIRGPVFILGLAFGGLCSGRNRRFVEGLPEIYIVSNVKVNGEPIGSLGDGEAVWHTDMSYLEVPPKASILYSLEVPPFGGNTSFCTMYGIYEALPQILKDRIAG